MFGGIGHRSIGLGRRGKGWNGKGRDGADAVVNFFCGACCTQGLLLAGYLPACLVRDRRGLVVLVLLLGF